MYNVGIASAGCLLFIMWLVYTYKAMKKSEEIFSILQAILTCTIINKMENIQLFYSLVLQPQIYDPDPRTKSLMKNTAAMESFNAQNLLTKKQTFYQSVTTMRSNMPQDDLLTDAPKPKHKPPRVLKVHWAQRTLFSVFKAKRFLLVSFICALIRLAALYTDENYDNITRLSTSLAFARFYIMEINILPRTFNYELISKEGTSINSEGQIILDFRKQILKNLYGYLDQLKQADSIYYSSHINHISHLMNSNITETVLNDPRIVNNWYIAKIQSPDFTSVDFYQKLLATASLFAKNFEMYYSDAFPIIEKGLKYSIIANINNCDFLLNSFSTEGYTIDPPLKQKMEGINQKLIPVIYYGFELIFKELRDILTVSTKIHLSFVLGLLVALAISLIWVLVKFHHFLKRDAAEETYIENNILNLVDAVTLEDMEDKFVKVTSHVNFFRVVL
jgi:hypothetical protein